MTTENNLAPPRRFHRIRQLIRHRRGKLTAYIVLIAHLFGFLSSLNALMTTRTSQGAVAWIVALNSFPLAAVPVYWVFGRNKFQGYVNVRRELVESEEVVVREARERVEPFYSDFSDRARSDGADAAQRLADLPFLRGNEVELLIDGEATFDSILAGINSAERYVMVQFYIVRDDGLGRRLKEAMIERARAGVDVYFLYDEIGSHQLPGSYSADLREAGVRVSRFQSTRGIGNKFQLNFRNHRKIVVVDGRSAWVGGHNVGDEYLGLDPKFGDWRDTHLRIAGPSILGLQLSFVEDWHWATDELLQIRPNLELSEASDVSVLILPSGPGDELETASLMYQLVIQGATDRIWIASPYFVPDHGVMSSLHLAAKRGVDVRIIIPEAPDSRLVYYATYAFLGELLHTGVRIFRYAPGFLHHKVFLVDDEVSGVGTANFDNRSFRLNFEVTAIVVDETFASEMEEMFAADFVASREMTLEDVETKPWWFRVFARASYLTAPIL